MIKNIINIFHLIFYIYLMMSPFINICIIKVNALILLNFILFHFTIKYGKCGIINIEKYFLKDNFKNGFIYNLIKPVISYKNNIFYDKFYNFIILYIIILFLQLYNSEYINKIFNNIYILLKNKLK